MTINFLCREYYASLLLYIRTSFSEGRVVLPSLGRGIGPGRSETILATLRRVYAFVGGGVPTLMALDLTAALPVELHPRHGAVLTNGLDVPSVAADTKRLTVAIVGLPPTVALEEHGEEDVDEQELHGFDRAVLLQDEVELSPDLSPYAVETTCPHRPAMQP